jgi:regulator of sigma E protease
VNTIFALIALPGLATIGQLAVFLAVLGVLVVFHEFGHFVFAKLFGVRVVNFAVGFGPTILQTTRGETTYRLNALPLGGYCQMTGEDTADDGSADPGNLQHHPLWQRFIIIVAGPVFNLVLAAMVFTYIALAYGMPGAATNVIEYVQPNTPAARAGFQPGDQIQMLDGQAFKSGDEIVGYVHARPNQVIGVDLMRKNSVIHLEVKTTVRTFNGTVQGIFGFQPVQSMQRVGLGAALEFGSTAVFVTIANQVVGLYQAAVTRDSSVFRGPVGIAHLFIGAEQSSSYIALSLVATLSTVLGFFNLLPVPALDGGRIVFLGVEAVRRRPVDPEKEGLVHLTGFALLMVFVLFVTYHDIVQWVNGKGGL